MAVTKAAWPPASAGASAPALPGAALKAVSLAPSTTVPCSSSSAVGRKTVKPPSLWCRAPPITQLGHSLWTGQGSHCSSMSAMQCALRLQDAMHNFALKCEGPATCTISSTVHQARSES